MLDTLLFLSEKDCAKKHWLGFKHEPGNKFNNLRVNQQSFHFCAIPYPKQRTQCNGRVTHVNISLYNKLPSIGIEIWKPIERSVIRFNIML